jgi:hypothetical protein
MWVSSVVPVHVKDGCASKVVLLLVLVHARD